MDNFVVENLGPIAKADVTFGDLTILTGPQASGKTLFLETFKLVKDFIGVITDYREQNPDVKLEDLLNYFYGDGMNKIISQQTEIIYNNKQIDIKSITNNSLSSKLQDTPTVDSAPVPLKEKTSGLGGALGLGALGFGLFGPIGLGLTTALLLLSLKGDDSSDSYKRLINLIKKIQETGDTNLSESDKESIKKLVDAVREKIFFVPAQRSSAISEGRILLSRDFINSPYVLVKFSGYLQQFVKTQQYGIIRESIKDYNFLKNAEINMRRTAGSPRLEMTVDNQTVPYMAWSTGQREFTPLLMALDYFESIDNKEYIVIEEPELGLHPRAIIEFMFTVLKLMNSGVKVIISTHSSTPLDFVWTMNRLKHKGVKSFASLAEMFDFKIKDKDFFDGLFEKEIKVYYFAPDKKTRKVHSKDISSLDVESEDEDISNWGGMSLSADRAGSIVSKF